MRLVKLTQRDGVPVWVNPANVVSVEATYHNDTVSGSTLRTSLVSPVRVVESPSDVAALFGEVLP